MIIHGMDLKDGLSENFLFVCVCVCGFGCSLHLLSTLSNQVLFQVLI